MSTDIAGYTYDTALAASPVSLEDLNLLLATLLWTDETGVVTGNGACPYRLLLATGIGPKPQPAAR